MNKALVHFYFYHVRTRSPARPALATHGGEVAAGGSRYPRVFFFLLEEVPKAQGGASR